MKVSHNWLKQFINLSKYSSQQIADILTTKTCEVEQVYSVFNFSKKIIVGEIQEINPHPDADRLKICTVCSSKQQFIIVTGANNVIVHKKYPLATEGSVLPNGTTIKHRKSRGVLSEGMLCSAEELNMQDFIFPHIADQSGDLLELPTHSKTGEQIAHIFPIEDTIFDIDNKSLTHRPDLWGHFGFARELSAILNIPITKNPFTQYAKLNTALLSEKEKVNVNLKDKAAMAYSSTVIKNINVEPSTMEIQAYLVATGIRPINNIVDASNYVMLELGQPTHAFDRDYIQGAIEICLSQGGEELTTLDAQTRKLPKNIPLIKDSQKPVAIGGIMGGKNTEVNEQTKTLFIESATFHRGHIRKGTSKLSLRTEASQRFEKGLDPSLTDIAIYRFIEIISKSCLALEVDQVNTIRKESIKNNKIETTFSYILDRLGDIDLTPEQITKILNSLEIKCNVKEDQLIVEVPSFRSYYDIEIEEDIVEEVARIAGYERIQEKSILLPCVVPSHPNPTRTLEHQLRNLFSHSYHFTEVYNYSFHSVRDIALDTRYAKTAIEMKNPIKQDQKYLRISPLPGLLNNIANLHKKHNELSFYEIERIFLPQPNNPKELPKEKLFIAGILISPKDATQILTFMGSILGDLLSRLGLLREEQKYTANQENIFHPGRSGAICSMSSSDSKPLFKWGELHPKLIKEYGDNINKRIFYFESFLDDLVPFCENKPFYQPIPKFPSSSFEMTILANKYTPFQEIEEVIKASSRDSIIKNIHEVIECIGSFSSEQIPENKKAVSLRFTWTNHLKTIEHEELKELQNTSVQNLTEAGFSLK